MPETDHQARGDRPHRPAKAVLFDFHGTLAQVEEQTEWVAAAAWECGIALDPTKATALADRLVLAGRAGGPLPTRIPPHLMEVWADRDLRPEAHRAAYRGLAATVDAGIEGFADALYDRLLRPEGWRPYLDTLSTLQALTGAGVPVAVVSNIGFDIRELCDALGFGEYVSAYALSYEVGRCKPDPGIFWSACAALRVLPEDTLMVGDTPADAGAVAAGCRALILPAADAGRPNGLTAAVTLALG